MFDIAALGESLIDFTPCGRNESGMNLFAQNPGGAPANVLAMAAKLGGKTAFIGKVGDDDFGRFLKSEMEKASIDVSGLLTDPEHNTTLAFVHLSESGDRSFSFYRKNCADIFLRPEEVNRSILKGCRIFHFGSVSLTDEPCRGATIYAAKAAKDEGALISYDPNYRPLLWDCERRAAEEMRNALELADIVKVSEEEMRLLSGKNDLLEGSAELARGGAALVVVTLGPGGAFFYNGSAHGLVPAYDVKTIDTTGAGDAFLGSLLFNLRAKTKKELRTIPESELRALVAFSNAAGSLTTTRKGAVPAMPGLGEIENCLKNIHTL